MAEFSIPKSRDAYAAILGFRYQVDWTILRLLELEANTHLELECGEDIDIVAGALTTANDEAVRTLEQIKHLGKRLTLRSPECLAALSNCAGHQLANPALALRFRFCTNANIGIESPSPFPDRRAAIEVWRSLQEDDVVVAQGEDLQRIAEILREAKRPTKYNADRWREFQAALSDPTRMRLVKLVQMFEWAIGQPMAEKLSDDVRLKLRECGFADSDDDAEHLHGRLFLRVMQTLSKSGRKLLDASFLQTEAALPPLRDPDRRLLTMIATEVFTLDIRLEEIEQQILASKESIDDAHQRIDELAAEIDSHAAIVAGTQLISTAQPQQVAILTNRETAVKALVGRLQGKSWLRLRGAIGAGKSQLSLLVAKSLDCKTKWLSLRDRDENSAAHLLWQFLSRLSKEPNAVDAKALSNAATRTLGPGSLLVIEDVPRLTTGTQLDTILALLVEGCRASRVSLLTTSHFELTPSWISNSDSDSVLVPPLDVEDVRELLIRYGAPVEQLVATEIALLHSRLEGHPMLTVATIRGLASRGWPSEVTGSYDASDAASEAIEEAVHRLLQSVDDVDARSLLYRLSRVIGTFRERTLLAAADAVPRITRPRERFVSVEGLWVDRFADREYSVSPLIRPLSGTEVDDDVRVSVDEALVAELLSRDRLSVVDVGNAATYSARSGDVNWGALFLLFALGKARRLPREDVHYLLARSWFYGDIPEDVRLAVKLSLRARQVSLAAKIGEAILPVLDDAEKLLAVGSDEDAWAKASYLLLTIYEVGALDFLRACRHVKELAKLAHLVAKQMPNSGKTVGRAMWMTVTRIRTKEHFNAWMACLEAFDQWLLEDAFRWGPAKQGCGVAVNGPWMAMHLTGASPDEWRGLVSTYAEATVEADKLGLQFLKARLVAAQIIVLSEYLTDLPAAVRLADAVLSTEALLPSNKFLIQDALGRQYLYRNEQRNAIKTLSAAIELQSTDYPEILSRTHLELGSILGEQEPLVAVAHAQISVNIGKSEPKRVGEQNLIVSLGELAIACWLAGDIAGAFFALDDAVERFFDARLDGDTSKQLLPRLGHCVSYLALLEATGKPPDDDELSAPPWRREFLGWGKGMADHHDRRNFPVHHDAIFSSLSMLAIRVDQEERAAYWAQRGFDEAVRHEHLTVMGVTGYELFAALVLQGQTVEALDRIRYAMRATWATYLLRQKGLPMDSARDPASILGNRPNERWHGAERWSIQQGLLPLLLYLARKEFENRSEAHKSLHELVAYAEKLGDQIALQTEWQAALSFVRITVSRTGEWSSVRRTAEQWTDESPHGLRWLGYAACTMQPNVPLQEAAILHTRLAWYIERHLGSRSTMQRRILVPFLKSFWDDALKRRSGELHSALVLEEGLRKSKVTSFSDGQRTLLTTALQATDARLPNNQRNVRRWLRGRDA